MANAGKIRWDYAQLDQIATKLAHEAARAATMHEGVKRAETTLRANDWIGKGASRFYAEMDASVYPAIGRLIHALEEAGRVVKAMGALLRQAELEAAHVLDATPGHATPSPPRAPGDDGLPALRDGKDTRLTYGEVDGHLFVTDGGFMVGPGQGGVDANDIKQGKLGSCATLATLGAIAMRNPGFIESMITDNGDGTYTVLLYKRDDDGRLVPNEVVVDAQLPLKARAAKQSDGADTQYAPAFAKTGDEAVDGGGELWVALVEKAVAVQEGGYGSIDGRWVSEMMPRLTGEEGRVYDAPALLDFDTLADSLDSGHAVAMSTYAPMAPGAFGDITQQHPLYKNGTLQDTHAYYVAGADRTTREVILRNPHGVDKGEIRMSFAEFQRVSYQVAFNPVYPA